MLSAGAEIVEREMEQVADVHLYARGLVKVYKKRRVVDQVDLEVGRGEVVGLLGPNGAGKTTTFYMIVGLIRPEAGDIYFGHRKLTGLPTSCPLTITSRTRSSSLRPRVPAG